MSNTGRTTPPDADRETLVSIIDRYVGEGNFSGVVLMKQGKEEILAEARGFANRGCQMPNGLETRFDTASLGKLFTATAAFRLSDRGLIGLGERIGDIVDLAGTKIPPEVTLAHCLSHSSGIADDADEEAGEDYEELFKTKPCYMLREAKDFLPQFAYKDPLFAPGTRSRYNNCAYVLAGLALEARSGLSFHELVRQEVLLPAGLASSGYYAKDGIEPGLAEGYASIEDEGGGILGYRKNIYAFPPIGSPDSGIYVTARDIARLFEAIEGENFLSPASREAMLAPVIDAYGLDSGGSRKYGYCLEFSYDAGGRLERYGKDGCNPGVSTIAMRYPASGGFIVALSNQDSDVWRLNLDLAKAAGFAAG
jgi:CubicO group peptidase (beta-lactamase class C family)